MQGGVTLFAGVGAQLVGMRAVGRATRAESHNRKAAPQGSARLTGPWRSCISRGRPVGADARVILQAKSCSQRDTAPGGQGARAVLQAKRSFQRDTVTLQVL